MIKEKFNYYKRIIATTYGDNTSIYSKGKTLRKFGRNEDMSSGITEMIWTTGTFEDLISTNAIDTISSSNTGDSQTVVVEGHTIDGSGNLTFVVQSKALNGQNKVVLDTPLARATRIYNNDSTEFLGNVYVYQDTAISAGVPTDTTKIHITAIIGNNQSLKCATSISKNDYWIINRIICTVEKAQTAVVDFKIQLRLKGKVWRTIQFVTVSGNQGTYEITLDSTPIIIPPNSDVRMIGTASTNAVVGGGEISGFLALII